MNKDELYLLEKLSKDDNIQYMEYCDHINKALKELRFRLNIGVKAV